MHGAINKKMEEVRKELIAAEAQRIADLAKCGLAEAIFSLGIACLVKKKRMERQLKALRESGHNWVKFLEDVRDDFNETKRVLGMVSALMQST